VDWERFREGKGSLPKELLSLSRPRFGFTGLVDGRIDVELIEGLAARFAGGSFVFVGPRQLARGPLDELPNVHFLPSVPYDDVPAVLASFDAGILPYRENTLTHNINPLKLREFLASGIPVVASPLPEVLRFRDWVRTPKGLEEWQEALEGALAEGRSRSSARAESVRRDGWDERALEFAGFCLEAERVHRERS
jgi:glycosyltransferase involved in cell wall biosynthesis